MKLKKVSKVEKKPVVNKKKKIRTRKQVKAEMMALRRIILDNHRATPEQKEKLESLQKELKSKIGRSSKNKGANYERNLAKLFNEAYRIELKRTPQSGGFAKKSSKADDFRGDIITVDKDINLKLHIEAKNHKKANINGWLKQANDDCPEGKIPIVIWHKENTNPKVGEQGNQQDLVLIDLKDFFRLVPKANIIEEKRGK
jgi:hypothetical protein